MNCSFLILKTIKKKTSQPTSNFKYQKLKAEICLLMCTEKQNACKWCSILYISVPSAFPGIKGNPTVSMPVTCSPKTCARGGIMIYCITKQHSTLAFYCDHIESRLCAIIMLFNQQIFVTPHLSGRWIFFSTGERTMLYFLSVQKQMKMNTKVWPVPLFSTSRNMHTVFSLTVTSYIWHLLHWTSTCFLAYETYSQKTVKLFVGDGLCQQFISSFQGAQATWHIHKKKLLILCPSLFKLYSLNIDLCRPATLGSSQQAVASLKKLGLRVEVNGVKAYLELVLWCTLRISGAAMPDQSR